MGRKDSTGKAKDRYASCIDAELIRLYLGGDSLAFTALVERYQRPLTRYTFRITNDAALAADAVQQSWIDAWQAIQKGAYKEDGHFSRWMIKIVHARAMKALKDNPHQPRSAEQPEHQDDDLNAEEQIIVGDSSYVFNAHLFAAIEKLPPRERKVFWLHWIQGLSYDAISGMLNIKARSVKQMFYRALHELKRWMKPPDSIL